MVASKLLQLYIAAHAPHTEKLRAKGAHTTHGQVRWGPSAFIGGPASSRYEDCSATLRNGEIGKVCVVADDWVAEQRGCRFFFFPRFFFGFEIYLSPGTFPTQLLWKPSVFVEMTDHEISPLGQLY